MGKRLETVTKVLIIGMSGLIGNALRRQLGGRYDLSALNRRSVEGVKCYKADVRSLDAILPAFRGIETVVHLAGVKPSGKPGWRDYLEVNLEGTYNVFEASRIAGVKRIIFASSGATVGGWDTVPPYDSLVKGEYSRVSEPWPRLTHETPPRPAGIYGATKVWGESLGRVYCDKYGVSVIFLRIGLVNSEDRPTEAWHFPVWCSQRDVARMVERCIDAPASVKYDIFYVTSRNRWGFRDLDHAKEVVGFVPEDSAESPFP